MGCDIYSDALPEPNHFIKPTQKCSPKSERTLPGFLESELNIGSLLGKGSFSSVYEVISFSLGPNNDQTKEQNLARKFLNEHTRRQPTGSCRYAVKSLCSENVVNDKPTNEAAVVNLAHEAKILSLIDHPNIIKLRGLGLSSEIGFGTGKPEVPFLILDRLNDTLAQRISKWTQETSHKKSKLKYYFKCSTKRTDEICSSERIENEQIKILLDIVSALKYLHGKNIIYRDLKPENFAFDRRGMIKLLDFGLAKELKSCHRLQDGTYNLTGEIGTLRYMAPEVVNHETYNLSADIYSFSILLWEVMSLKKAFEGFDRKKHSKLVANGKLRPKISTSLPEALRIFLEEGWSPDIYDRPSFNEIYMTFSEMVCS